MADLAWGGADTFVMTYGLSGSGSAATAAIQWAGLTDPVEAPERDHAISGNEQGTVDYTINGGNGTSGQNTGNWDASGATAAYDDSSEWDPPSLTGTRAVASATVDINFFAEITSVGSGTGTVGELIAPNAISSARDVLTNNETLTFDSTDTRLALDTQFRIVIVLNQFAYTKTTYTDDAATPESAADTMNFTGANDGDDISVPELKSLGNVTYTVSTIGAAANTTAFAATTALASKGAAANTHSAGTFPHLVTGSGTITHRNITLAWSGVNVDVNIAP